MISPPGTPKGGETFEIDTILGGTIGRELYLAEVAAARVSRNTGMKYREPQSPNLWLVQDEIISMNSVIA